MSSIVNIVTNNFWKSKQAPGNRGKCLKSSVGSERRSVKPEVSGSIPGSGSNKKTVKNEFIENQNKLLKVYR